MNSERKYHHGDLRSSLLREARALLAAEGVEGLSLRKLADQVGVSRTAPYHHFKDKHALLCALAAQGFRELDDLLDFAIEPGKQRQNLSQLVGDYIDFARRDAERYDLMFGRRLWKQTTPTAELQQIAYATFRRYARQMAALAAGAGDERRVLRMAQASWATLHGLSHLLIDGIYVDVKDMAEVSEVAIELMLGAIEGRGG